MPHAEAQRYSLLRTLSLKKSIIQLFTSSHCTLTNTEIQSAGRIQEQGVLYTLQVKTKEDMNREVVKSDSASTRIPQLDFEIPAFTQKGCEIRMAFVLYKHLGSYLSTENASMKFSSETLNTNYSVIVNSPIITAAINKDSNKVYLSDPVIFTVKHIQQSEENFNPNCSFWSYSKRSMTGFWSTQDCRLLGTNLTHTTCSCTHLTNFAVLMAHVDVTANMMCLTCSSMPAEFFPLLCRCGRAQGFFFIWQAWGRMGWSLSQSSEMATPTTHVAPSDMNTPTVGGVTFYMETPIMCLAIPTAHICGGSDSERRINGHTESAGVMLSLGTMSDNSHPSILKEAAGRHGYLMLSPQRCAYGSRQNYDSLG
ncbi:hypothetical protein QQF64_029517 [Cirrhinus molitorella]|uniref:GAIN-B domain-containing protein n=1 Tax=Cirrhinus molitorella TaxID=172907 RepID=A0ABR3N0Z8_9TELE